MTLYLSTYSAIARNVGAGDLAAALAAIPRDTATETLLGLVSLADVTTIAPPFVTRAMSHTSSPAAIIPDPQLGAFLTNYYTATFRDALSTPITPTPVGVVGTTLAPILWVRGDVAPGALIPSWPDLSGHGHDLVQAIPGSQPSRIVNGTINQLVAHFGGAAIVSTAAPIAFDEFAYAVTFESAGPAGLLFERGPNATASSGENLFQSTPASTAIRRLGVTNSGAFSAGWGTDSHWHLAVMQYTHAAGGELVVDGVAVAPTAPLGAEAVSALLHVGSRVGGALPLTGDVRELLVFPGGLDPASLAALSAYMRAQIGI